MAGIEPADRWYESQRSTITPAVVECPRETYGISSDHEIRVLSLEH